MTESEEQQNKSSNQESSATEQKSLSSQDQSQDDYRATTLEEAFRACDPEPLIGDNVEQY